MTKLTEFGKVVRKLRIEQGETMLEMGAKVNRSASFLSAVETGRKPVPVNLVEEIARAYELPDSHAEELRALASKSASSFRLTPKTEVDQALVSSLAAKLDLLEPEQKEAILRILDAE